MCGIIAFLAVDVIAFAASVAIEHLIPHNVDGHEGNAKSSENDDFFD